MVVINPSIENTLTFEGIDWEISLTAHKKKSSKIFVSPDQKYLKKTKQRKGHKRDNEFYNLVFWRALLEKYNEHFKTRFYAPQPYVSEGRDLIMEYFPGMDLERLLTSASIAFDDLHFIFENVGKLNKIKENEKLAHNDFALRHLLVDGRLFGLIDLEQAQRGNGKVAEENKTLISQIKELYKGEVDPHVEVGYNSIPPTSLFDSVLDSVKKTYGERANFYLVSRYRG